jgi:hypothetical protein
MDGVPVREVGHSGSLRRKWAWNGQMVVVGTGETLLGPAAAGGGKRACL